MSCTCHTRAAASERLTADLEVGWRALAEGDVDHALHHLAGAVAEAPTSPAVDSLRRAVAAQRDLTFHAEAGAFYGTVALAAMALAEAGDFDGALSRLAQVAELRPDVGFEHLLTRWLTETDSIRPETADHVSRVLSQMAEGTIGLHHLLPGERVLLASWAAVARAFDTHGPEPMRRYPVPGLLRRVGAFDEALDVARAIGGQGGKIQEALTLRAMGDGEGALRVFDTSGPFEEMERARCLIAMGEDAEPILRRHTHLPEACVLLEGSPAGLDGVARLDEAQRAAVGGGLAAPSDATANAMRDGVLRKVLQTVVRGWESPSNRLYLALCGRVSIAEVAYSLAPGPEERPLAQVRGATALWRTVQGVVVPAVLAPRGSVGEGAAKAVAGVVARPGAFWRVSAGLPAGSALEYLAAMVHPPADLDLSGGPDALFRYQVMCAMGVARQPWSEAKAALESAIFGPLDWSSAAAIWALAERTRHDAAVAFEGRAMLVAAADDLAPLPCEPRFDALVTAFQTLPGMPGPSWQVLQRWWRDHGAPDEVESEREAAAEPPRSSAPEPAPAPFTASKAADSPAGPWPLVWVGVTLFFIVLAVLAA